MFFEKRVRPVSIPRAIISFALAIVFAIALKLTFRQLTTWFGTEHLDEIAELLNAIIFALIGAGAGIATFHIKPRTVAWGLALLLSLPLALGCFFLNPVLDYGNWIQRIESQERISHDSAVRLTDEFLKKEVGFSGFLGYYQYVAKEFLFGDRVEKRKWVALIVNWGARVLFLALSLFTLLVAVTDGLDYGSPSHVRDLWLDRFVRMVGADK